MDNLYHHQASSEPQQPLGYNGGYLETPPYTANRPPGSSALQADHDPAAPRWTPPGGYGGGHPYGFRSDFPAPPPHHPVFPYGFDPSVPPPPFGCSPPGHFPTTLVTAAPVHAYSSRGAATFQPFGAGPQAAQYDLEPGHRQQRDCEDYSGSGALLFPPQGTGKDRDWSPGTTTRPEDETALQRRQDQQWLGRFLQDRDNTPKSRQTQKQQTQQPPHRTPVPDLRAALNRAAQLVAQLAESCETLRNNVEDGCVWPDSYVVALNVKKELQEKLQGLGDSECLAGWRAKLSRVANRRARRLRARKLFQVEEEHREELLAEKEAAINKWRMQRVHQVEEKKKERELKLAADAVLCEVRKKQADVKRMHDILRSLEKLRRLRKEAASRKGIVTERECDEAFGSRLEQLRNVMKKRTAIYSTEEKALMVMLEGEQEEERRREQEKRVKKERERHLQRKRRVNTMLFGDELPADSVLQPFRHYYTQAERSLHALLQIRREWDVFAVPADHPDGSAVPQSWILPDAPSDHAWASALCTADTD
ncbi:programmed cell death protein 7 [Sebastes fasciatus]|uniref:programmed cell death protein 7 n=1 Tax=Sebastes fasciatus TaxID=394691 RepID=UPI003D9EAC7E